MRRLVVNPGTPQAWEIQLKPGTNLLGRGFANDFQIQDPSVSSSHCEIVVGDDAVTIKDLGSTNGTFVNQAPVREARIEPGQAIRLGAVEMRLESGNGETAAGTVPPAAAPMRVAVKIVSEPPVPPPISEPAVAPQGSRFCKFHPKSPARYLCQKCNRTFCEMCVSSRVVGGVGRKVCRSCGVECVPLQARAAPTARRKGFFRSVPGAFLFPLKGSGLLMLLVGTVFFAVVKYLSFFSLILQIVFAGYLFAYMQNVIHATAAGDESMPDFPDISNFGQDILVPFFQFLGVILVCFSPVIFVEWWSVSQGTPAGVAIISAVAFGCLYFPMAFLAVAMLDTVAAVNPLLVAPSILKVFKEYIVAVLMLGIIFAARRLSDVVLQVLFGASLTTHSMSRLVMMVGALAVSNFIGLYLLTVNMRILGLLYLTNKEKLGWFGRRG